MLDDLVDLDDLLLDDLVSDEMLMGTIEQTKHELLRDDEVEVVDEQYEYL